MFGPQQVVVPVQVESFHFHAYFCAVILTYIHKQRFLYTIFRNKAGQTLTRLDQSSTMESMSPGPCTSATIPSGDFDSDWLYASWLCDEDVQIDYESIGLSDVEVNANYNEESPNSCPAAMPLSDILNELSRAIDLDSISKFNISRSHIWEGTVGL